MMNIQNPAAILQLMNIWSRFRNNHPKFPKFISAEGESFDSNLKVNADDMEMIEQLRSLTLER